MLPTHFPTVSEQRAQVDAANRAALIEVLRRTRVTIRASEFDSWRPTKQSTEEITGVTTGFVTILATDGNLGLFVQYANDDETLTNVFFGHVQHFQGKVQTLHGSPTPYHAKDLSNKPRKKSKTQLSKRDERIAERVMQLLQELDEKEAQE